MADYRLRGKLFLALSVMALFVSSLLVANPASATGANRILRQDVALGPDLDEGEIPGEGFESEPIEGSYLVVMNAEPGTQVADEATSTTGDSVAELGGEVTETFDTALAGFSAELSEQAADILEQSPEVAFVEQNRTFSISSVQSDATWGLDRIDQQGAVLNSRYNYAHSGAGVDVYIIDSGVDLSDPEFSGRAGNFVNFAGDGIDNDCEGHGTHVAGTIGSETWGVAKDATIHAVKVLDCDGTGTTTSVVAGIDWVAANASGPSVANLSVSSLFSNAIDQAIERLVAAGITTVVAAGNEDVDACNRSPASTPVAITVGSTTIEDDRSRFSNWGSCVDVFAPGSSITSTLLGGGYVRRSGTSMAAAHAAGVAALYLEAEPQAAPSQVANAIVSGATAAAISDVGDGSPNLLLHSYVADVGAPEPNPAPAPFTISIDPTYTLNEGTALVRFPFSIDGRIQEPFVIEWQLTEDTGSVNDLSDDLGPLTTTSGQMTIFPSQANIEDLQLPFWAAVDDGIDEPEERLLLTIKLIDDPSSLGSIGVGTADLIIIDNDEADETAPETATGQLSGQVTDQNRQSKDGVVVDLFTENRTTHLGATVTDDDGNYQFADLAQGCYTLTFIAPEDEMFASGRYLNLTGCLDDTGGRSDLDAVVLSGGAKTMLGGVVSDSAGAAVEGVVVDLFTTNDEGSRISYQRSTATGADGRYEFDLIDGGCYGVVLIAPPDTTFGRSGRWLERFDCLEAGSGSIALDGELDHPVAPGEGFFAGTVSDGTKAGRAVADLFAMEADGSRGGYLTSVNTDDLGQYRFEIKAGCYTVVLITNGERVFENDTRWHQRSGCVAAGETFSIDARLDS